jgi:predicted Rossmann fold flavoprotein
LAYDAIVIGGGAAGLMCAAIAGRRGRRVVVLERTEEIGKKILISGGGRCNFTNLYVEPENFICSNPHFHKSALARYTPSDFIDLVEKYGIAYHEKKDGQLFCDDSARQIVDMLANECRAAEADIVLGARISEVRQSHGFIVLTETDRYKAPVLVIAAGGLSIPKIGATSFGYDVARQFGLKIVPPRPALVPLVFGDSDRKDWCDLAGVAADVVASFDDQSFRERMLITHKGISGPAILQISSYWDGKSAITLDLLPNTEKLEPPGKRSWPTVLSEHEIPKRFADRWIELYTKPERPPSPEDLAARLHAWQVTPVKTEGYGKAEVTAGGVHPDELSSKTMESRSVAGLYFIGEVVDVTGHLGGFNFQWAWASGFAAGQAI